MQNSSIPGLSQPPAEILASSADRLKNQLRSVEQGAGTKPGEDLKRAAQEFESLFVAYLLKIMRETIEESGLTEGGFGKGIYTDLFDQELSRDIAKHGVLGISDILYKRLLPEGPGVETPPPRSGLDAAPATEPGPANDGSAPAPDRSPGSEAEIPDFRLPIQSPVSSEFGPRTDPFSGKIRFHKGMDLAAPEGMEVRAALRGRVVFVGHDKVYGNSVVIRHAEGLETRYAHLGSTNVHPGENIDPESVIGVVGRSGRSTGPHLHFEVLRGGARIDPRAAVAD